MFKRKISKAEFDAFTGDDAWKKNLYKADGNDYKLVEVEQDNTAAEQAIRDKETAEANLATLQTTVSGLQTELADLRKDKKKEDKKNDKRPQDEIIADLEAQVEAAKNDGDGKAKALEQQLKDALKLSHAQEIAKHFMTDLIMPEIMARMDIDLTDGKNKLIITKDGKASAMSLEDLKKEMLANPKHKGIIKASDASGGGAGLDGLPSDGKGGTKSFADMSEAERTSLYKTNPTEFRRLSAAHQEKAGQTGVA